MKQIKNLLKRGQNGTLISKIHPKTSIVKLYIIILPQFFLLLFLLQDGQKVFLFSVEIRTKKRMEVIKY